MAPERTTVQALREPWFQDEAAAFVKVEQIKWPDGPVCPHCGTRGHAGRIISKGARIGLWLCHQCRRQFRVTIGTIFEGSRVPLHLWLQACAMSTSADQLQEAIGVSYETALLMTRHIVLAHGYGRRHGLDEIVRRLLAARGPHWEAAC